MFTDVTHTSVTFAVGQTLTGVGIAADTKITALLTGTGANNGGTYEVSIPQSVASTVINGNLMVNNYTLNNTTTDVYSTVAGAPTPGAFIAISEASWSGPDCIYQMVYRIQDLSLIHI